VLDLANSQASRGSRREQSPDLPNSAPMTSRRRVPSRPQTVVAQSTVACSNCGLRDLCLPEGLSDTELKRLDGMVARRVTVARGAHLYRCGEPFKALYAVRAGFFKTRTLLENGHEHVSAFQMAGDLLGMDGVASERHTSDAIALEDCQVCVIPFEPLGRLSREFPQLQKQLLKIMGRELVRDRAVMTVLASMRSEERVAAFLLDLSRRLVARGFSASSLRLRMTREEIGTYLGLTVETISRCLSSLDSLGMLQVRHREIRIANPTALQGLIGGQSWSSGASMQRL
jgi:CRP/FNR family transcriptional regulator